MKKILLSAENKEGKPKGMIKVWSRQGRKQNGQLTKSTRKATVV